MSEHHNGRHRRRIGQRRRGPLAGSGRLTGRRLPPHLLPGITRRAGGRLHFWPAFIMASVLGGLALWLGAVGVAAGGAYATWSAVKHDLPTVQSAEDLHFATTKIYDRNWMLLSQVSDPQTGWRTPVGYGEILDHIHQQQSDPNAPHTAWIFDATIAAEDSSFWTNPGVDPIAITRSFLGNITGGATSGASTITQQLVRELFPEKIGYQRSYMRKMREAVVAYEFTKHFTKQQILEMYLNDVYYGNRSYGIDAASESYFNKHPWSLSLGEASMLAGMPQAPSLYDPTQNYEIAKARQKYVLDQMVRQRMITSEQADDAYAEPLTIVSSSTDQQTLRAPHFVNFVKSYIEQKYGAATLYQGGLTVRTTLDYSLQAVAQQIVTDHVASLAYAHVNNGDLVAIKPWSGEIVAMVGSADYYNDAIDGQVNVTLQPRSPGSSIKPVNYLAAFEKGWNPNTVILDYDKKWPVPDQPGKVFEPHNDTLQHFGAVTARVALANSLNVPAVQTLQFVGVQNLIDLDHKMGNKSTLWNGYYGLALTLGGGDVTGLEHTNVFATLANEGRYVPSTPLLSVTDDHGKTLYALDTQHVFEQGEQVAPAGNVYQVTSILTSDDARQMIWGLGTQLAVPELNRPVAAKTGTSEDFRDGWTMGYTTDLAVGVWVGNTDNSPTNGMDGIVLATPIWHKFMVQAHDPRFAATLAGPDGKPLPTDFAVPDNVYQGQVCVATGQAPIPGAATITTWLVRGEEPKQPCNRLTPEQAADLRAALSNTKQMTASGLSRLYEYAAMTGYSRGSRPTPTPTTSGP